MNNILEFKNIESVVVYNYFEDIYEKYTINEEDELTSAVVTFIEYNIKFNFVNVYFDTGEIMTYFDIKNIYWIKQEK